MIYLFTGTPGSGKSMHVAKVISDTLNYQDKYIVTNIPINLDYFSQNCRSKFFTFDFDQHDFSYLQNISRDYYSKHNNKLRESRIKLIIDEAQLYFNSRTWNDKSRSAWNRFFTLHRHLGYDIYFVCQYEDMLDKQIRFLVEYQFVHRKILSMGWRGFIVFLLSFGRRFACIKYCHYNNQKLGTSMLYCSRHLFKIYDTFQLF